MDYSSTVLSIIIISVYIGLIVLYIMLAVKVWKACSAILEIKDQIKDMSYRDTARYVAEINNGSISEEDQEEAQKLFNNE